MKKYFSDYLLWLLTILISNGFLLEIARLAIDENTNHAFIIACGLLIFLIAFDTFMWWVFNTKLSVLKVKVRYLSDIDTIYESINGDLIDLRASEDVEMKKGEFKLIPLGVAMKLPRGYKAQLVPRSSTYKNFRILQVNAPGQIDNTYCGDNDQWYFPALAMEDTVIHKGDRICQFEIVPTMGNIEFEEVDSLDDKDRGGFGSSGIA